METKSFDVLIVVREPHEISGNYISCNKRDVLNGSRTIKLGTNMEEAKLHWRFGYARPWVYEKYTVVDYTEFIELHIANGITHECLHILCAQLAPEDKKMKAGNGVDFVDYMGEVSSL